MKRVLIFSLTYYPDLVAGAEIPVRKTTDRIDPSVVAFDMITLRFDATLPKVEKIGNVTVHRVGFAKDNPRVGDLSKSPLKWNKYLYPFFALRKARELHKKNNYDALWSPMTSYASFGALFFKLLYPKVKYIFTLNDGDPIEYLKRRTQLVGPLFNMIYTKADLIHAPSTYLGEISKMMGYRGHIEYIPNALDVENFVRDYPQSEIEAVQKKLGKRDGEVMVITTSRLVKKNAVDDCIKAIALLPSNYHFYILGKGPDLTELEALAKNIGVTERVHFLGYADLSEIPKYLKACDVFIRPSRSEGMGNSPVEAMAAGIPVVATQAGGLADSIIDPELNPDKQATALAVAVGDTEAMARQVKRLVEDEALRTKLTAYAKQFAQNNYNSENIDRAMKDKVFGATLGVRIP